MNQPEDDDDLALAAPEIASARRRLEVSTSIDGERIDKVLARLLPEISRSRIQRWIEAGAVRLNDAIPGARAAVFGGDVIDVDPPPSAQALAFEPESMSLDIVYEDDTLIVLDKPPGRVVHPAAGNWSGTLLNGLLAFDERLARVPRAGIVHRLDADTSGLMVVARTVVAQMHLVRQLQEHSVTREYWAIVHGIAPPALLIDASLARDPRNRLRFRVSASVRAKPARTQLRRVATTEAGGAQLSWIACRLETGRTHQIRAHLESIGHPLVGDPVYRRGRPLAGRAAPWASFERQALHAWRLALTHPASGERVVWSQPPPADMRDLMQELGFEIRQPIEVFS